MSGRNICRHIQTCDMCVHKFPREHMQAHSDSCHVLACVFVSCTGIVGRLAAATLVTDKAGLLFL